MTILEKTGTSKDHILSPEKNLHFMEIPSAIWQTPGSWRVPFLV